MTMTHIFIINPYAGQQTFANDLRTKLESYKDLDYFVFNTRYAGYETELVQKIEHIFEGEELRFYCCGGSGTMRNILNGISDLTKVEVAFFPCGLTNDFLYMFGKDEHRFYQLDELINGDVVEVDYIKTNHGISLNSLSTGLDSNCIEQMNKVRILRHINENLPYTLSVLYSIFISQTLEYEVTFNKQIYVGKFAEIFIGNGSRFGGNMFYAEDTCINDGKVFTRLSGNNRGFGLIGTLMAITRAQYEKYNSIMKCGEATHITLRRTNGKPFTINQDGDLVKNVTVCKAEVVHKGLRLVVPKGVKI